MKENPVAWQWQSLRFIVNILVETSTIFVNVSATEVDVQAFVF